MRPVISVTTLLLALMACSEAARTEADPSIPEGDEPAIADDDASSGDAKSVDPSHDKDGGPYDEDAEGPSVDPETGCSIVSDARLETANVHIGPFTPNVVLLEGYVEPASLSSTSVLPDGGVRVRRGWVRLEIYKGARAAFAPGTTNLACPPDASCESSKLYDAASSRVYGVESGTITTTSAPAPLSNEIAGSLSKIVFRQLRNKPVEGGSIDVIDPAGACFVLPAATFDTTAPVGKPCNEPDDCGSSNKVCDPKTLTCNVGLCSGPNDCASSESCLAMGGYSALDPQGRACTKTCSPWSSPASTCGAGLSCRWTSNTTGLCFRDSATPKGLGAACELESLVNECGAGLVCHRSVCTTACNYFAESPGCAAADRCHATDTCGATNPKASPAAVGAPCTLPLGETTVPCGDDGKAYRGTCAGGPPPFPGAPPEPPKCHPLCNPSAPSCAQGTSCQMLFGGSIGFVCK